MRIVFKNIKIHHFLSYGDAELKLDNTGYILVTGKNNNPDDLAKSNGSGKSTIWSAICFALTGETIQGLKTNLGNIYYNDGCWVELEFDIDGNCYKLLRSKDDKTLGTDLKIYVNGVNKSGKGVRESQAILQNILPDLTSQLIGSVIILGQGMPHKFSDNTPSKRKELLEELSKSDYMIESIKEKLNCRLAVLNDSIADTNQKILLLKTKIDFNQDLLNNFIKEKEQLVANSIVDYDSSIAEMKQQILDTEKNINNKSAEKDDYTSKYHSLLDTIMSINDDKQKELNSIDTTTYNELEKLNEKLTDYKTKQMLLKQEITRLKNIKDICPTCGQKIPNVIKPDTKKQEEDLNTITEELKQLESDINNLKLDASYRKTQIEQSYKQKLTDYNQKSDSFKKSIYDLDNELKELNQNDLNYKNMLTKLEYEQQHTKEKLQEIDINIGKYTKDISDLNNSIKPLEDKKQCDESSLDVINKMMVLVKRDFRGVLLNNVIEFINNRVKKYGSYVFHSSNLDFELNGNNIDIVYNGRNYENLSGGEKQKIDLIVQFSIRDMLCTYLNFSSNIIVLDEIFDNLDSLGCSNVLSLITNELNDIKSIYIISHHGDELDIPMDYTINVSKDSNGISSIL